MKEIKEAWPSGHFHSVHPLASDISERWKKIDSDPRETRLPAINLNAEHQLALLEVFAGFQDRLPFLGPAAEGSRYYPDNEFFPYGDAAVLCSILHYARPKRIIEIGSGFSSALMLDMNDRYMDGSMACTFIEPNPQDRLYGLLRAEDHKRHTIIPTRIQEVDLDLFSELAENDILFIDSSHVSKAGSDVNVELFEILPRLKEGVYVHIHDIFYPFEYPLEWMMRGWFWNELYLLRAFLTYNSRFSIQFWNHYLCMQHREIVYSKLPLITKGWGSSFWLRAGL